jgi:CheY-like chemotaxis protein
MSGAPDLHPTLSRQLRRSGIVSVAEAPGLDQWRSLLLRVSTAYTETEQAEQLNERALDLASNEMQQLYRGLEQRVAERTHEIELAQAELQASNEELQAQSEELENQHEELQRTNIELEIKTQDLEAQRATLEAQNLALEDAKHAIEIKAGEAARASQYKSAFLASMSHELRTPLNSLLILSDILGQNADGNLTGEQIKFAETIHDAGADLLELINQILDLAKIESGGITLDIESIEIQSIATSMESMFRPIAKSEQLEFAVNLSFPLPSAVTSDSTKINQILKNLLSNAFKFTDTGAIGFTVRGMSGEQLVDQLGGIDPTGNYVSFSVSDSGVGIHADKKDVIFEAFQQGDQGTARKYGGTGLGLSISRELAKALGGDILLTSEPGRGSTFTLILPQDYVAKPDVVPELAPEPGPRAPTPGPSPGRTLARQRARPLLLVVEDDPRFASILIARAKSVGFETMLAESGEEAIRLAAEHIPDAVTLDLRLPDIDGWLVLDAFQQDPDLRHIPVHIISAEDQREHAQPHGAFGYLTKPVSRADLDEALSSVASHLARSNRLLLVGAEAAERDALTDLLTGDAIEVVIAETVSQAVEILAARDVGCVVLDLDLEPNDGVRLLAQLRDADSSVPIIGLTEAELTAQQRRDMHKHSATIITKGSRSTERLLDEASLFLHGLSRTLPASRRESLRTTYTKDAGLTGRSVVIVDDDPRNLFAVGNVLERHGMTIHCAENGVAGLELIKNTPEVDIVLMDIMMPEMDGYEATRQLRADPRYRNLPVLALTALAMSTDRAKCLEAGASDYITKPVDPDQLLSLIRVWLHQ